MYLGVLQPEPVPEEIFFINFHPGLPVAEIRVLVRPKLNRLGWHWGLQWVDGSVIHNTADNGLCVVTFDEFAASLPVRVERTVPLSDFLDTQQRVQHELSSPMPYRLTQNNCETFVNRVTGQGSVSGQVQAAFLVGTLIALIAVAAADS